MAEPAESTHLGTPPIPRTRLIGREAERASGRALLLDESVALLTLTGPGGVGKTRLALAIAADVADHFADGIVWVDLAPVGDPALVPATMARALGLQLPPGAVIEEELARRLRARQTLLLLDNCEHLLASVAELVALLLAACPAVQILATSRAPLQVRGEQETPVESISESDAIRLFVERTRAVRPAFRLDQANADVVAAICRHLDGLPLAIELAAARMKILSVEALLAQMSNRLRLLSGGARDLPARQQTIRDAIAWSYGLLDPAAQRLFRRLAVFSGGWTLESAQAVAGDPDGADSDITVGVTALVDHSLVRRTESAGEPRFAMLETIREFGLERLADSGEESAMRARHAAYFLDLVDRLNAAVVTHLPQAGQVLDQLRMENANLRAALAWFDAAGAAEPLLQLSGALHAFWAHDAHFREGQGWLERALAMSADAPAPLRVWGKIGLAAMLTDPRAEEVERALIDEAVVLARAADDPLCIGLTTEYRGSFAVFAGQFEQAEQLLSESRTAFAALSEAPWAMANVAHVDAFLARNSLAQGDFSTAEARASAALERERAWEQEHQAAYTYTCHPQTTLGHVARVREEHASALAHYQGALRDVTRSWDIVEFLPPLAGVAGTLGAVGRWAEAARLFGAVEAICDRYAIAFFPQIFDSQRALGLPEPWQQDGTSFDSLATLRAAVQARSPEPMPPIPDLEAAATCWSAGRALALDAAVAEALAVDLAASVTHPAPAAPVEPFDLTRREREILALLCGRLTDPEIAARLFLSPRTVSNHVGNILGKLGAENRREAAAVAAREHLV